MERTVIKTPEEIASACITHYCTPDEYDGMVKQAIAAAIQAERDELSKWMSLTSRDALALVLEGLSEQEKDMMKTFLSIKQKRGASSPDWMTNKCD